MHRVCGITRPIPELLLLADKATEGHLKLLETIFPAFLVVLVWVTDRPPNMSFLGWV